MINDPTYLTRLRIPTVENPLRILVSGCLAGHSCGYDESSYGEYPVVQKLLQSKRVKAFPFCPEAFSFGTPREMCDIHGGNGEDVLNGKARVLTESGTDWTEGMIKASEKMLELARIEQIELAIMMDTSAACGSLVIYNGNRFAPNKIYQIGSGVCTAQLRRNGFYVISQRDYASLEIVFQKIEVSHQPDEKAKDHHETEWFKSYFQKP
ncbi:MAG: 2-thiouracil desulfurase family protein [Flavobacteriales bacterium]|nr:2-thiouracil desulfurase family protein [Flavobacteriales bacterium]